MISETMFPCCRQNIFLQNCRKFSLRSRIITDNLAEKLNYYQNEQSPTSFSIQQFVDLSQDRASLYNLVRREIPTRISRVINELPQYFPPAVYDQRTAQFIQDYFEMTFKEIETAWQIGHYRQHYRVSIPGSVSASWHPARRHHRNDIRSSD